MKWVNRGKEFNDLAQAICNSDTEYVIWGAGVFGEAFCNEFDNELKIIGFVDSDVKKQDNSLCNKRIYAPKFIQNKTNEILVLISSGWTKKISDELNKMGYIKNRTYVHIDEFSSVYMMYKYNKLYLSEIGCQVTEKCTLKCKNCNAFIPKVEDARNITKEEILNNFKILFKWVDKVNVVGFTGGDAMIHPDFCDIVGQVAKLYYPNKIAHLEVYSNAVIPLSDETIQLFKEYDIFYRFTDYLPYTAEKQKVGETIKVLKEKNIRYDHVKFSQWYASGYPQESNGIMTEEGLVKHFNICDRRSCHTLYQKKLLNCAMAKAADRIGYSDILKDDVFELEPYCEEDKKALMEYMLGFSEKGYLNYCRKCNGGSNVNRIEIEAGEQIKI